MLPSHEMQQLSESQKNVSAAIRSQWRLFEKWLATVKSATAQESFKALEDTTNRSLQDPSNPHVRLHDNYDAKKRDFKRELDQNMVRMARLEWHKRLAVAGLVAEDWVDMTPAETLAVVKALGGEDDQSPPPTPSLPPGANASHAVPTSLPNGRGQQPPTTLSHPAHSHHPTAFEFVSSSTFRDEHTRNDGFSIESLLHADNWALEGHSDRWPGHVTARNLFQERSPSRNPAERATGWDAHFSEDLHDDFSAKSRSTGPRYIGPVLHDPQDTKTEEEEFERFKMEIREKKIWEFHYEAAAAGTQLARHLGKRNVDKQSVRTLLAEHDRSMERLKRDKEDERKLIVDSEREKRRTEFRRRGALHGAAANPWKEFEAVIGIGHDRDSDRVPGSRGGQQFVRVPPSRQVNGAKHAGWAHPHGQSTETIVIPRDDVPVASTSQHATDLSWASVSRASSSHQIEHDQSPERSGTSTPPKFPDPTSIPASHRSQMATADDVQVSNATAKPPRRKQSDAAQGSETPSAKPTDLASSSNSRRKNLSQGPQMNRKPERLDRTQDSKPRAASPPILRDVTSNDLSDSTRNRAVLPEEFWIPGKPDGKQDVAAEQSQAGSSSIKSTGSAWTLKAAQTLMDSEPAVDSGSSLWQVGRNMEMRRGRHARSMSNVVPTSLKSSRIASAWGDVRVESPSQNVVVAAPEVASDVLSRPRRVSDPPPPSPGLLKASAVQKQKSEGDVPKQPKSILKKTDAPSTNRKPPMESSDRKKGDNIAGNRKRSKATPKKVEPPPKPQKRVTIEDVSDEDADPFFKVGNKMAKQSNLDRPLDPGVIIEPKPNFSPIFQFAGEEPSEPQSHPTPATESSSSSAPPENTIPEIWYPPQDRSADQDDEFGYDVPHLPEMTTREKRVRWTPSVLARSDSPDLSVTDPLQAFAAFGWNPFMDQGETNAYASSSTQRSMSHGGADLMSTFEGVFESMSGEHQGGKSDGNRMKGKGKERAVRDDPAEVMEGDFRLALESLRRHEMLTA